jgi:hypothetical protein
VFLEQGRTNAVRQVTVANTFYLQWLLIFVDIQYGASFLLFVTWDSEVA